MITSIRESGVDCEVCLNGDCTTRPNYKEEAVCEVVWIRLRARAADAGNGALYAVGTATSEARPLGGNVIAHFA